MAPSVLPAQAVPVHMELLAYKSIPHRAPPRTRTTSMRRQNRRSSVSAPSSLLIAVPNLDSSIPSGIPCSLHPTHPRRHPTSYRSQDTSHMSPSQPHVPRCSWPITVSLRHTRRQHCLEPAPRWSDHRKSEQEGQSWTAIEAYQTAGTGPPRCFRLVNNRIQLQGATIVPGQSSHSGLSRRCDVSLRDAHCSIVSQCRGTQACAQYPPESRAHSATGLRWRTGHRHVRVADWSGLSEARVSQH